MHHFVVPRFHLAHGHVPARRRRRFEHRARGRAAAPHGFEEMARAARAVGVLVAEALLVARRLRDAHPLPPRRSPELAAPPPPLRTHAALRREPSVSWLPKRFWSPGACATRTRFQSASSSSATIIGMPVRTPCPISER